MNLPIASAHHDEQRYSGRASKLGLQTMLLLVGCLAQAAAFATEPARFQLAGSGTLALDQLPLKRGNLQLKAKLTASGGGFAAPAPVQDGGRFALLASLATTSLACYNDTIFRNDFDGDGF